MPNCSKDQPRSDELPSIVLKFATTQERQDFVTAMVYAMEDSAPPEGRRLLTADQAFRSILTWGVR